MFYSIFTSASVIEKSRAQKVYARLVVGRVNDTAFNSILFSGFGL